MSTPERQLAQRIRELRRRRFGPRGKDEFARRLGIAREDYDQSESGKLPSGELMVRMCELTGEDLQWLLTGVSSRGTVVISGAHNRYQDLIARTAQALDVQPRLATPLETFFDLLLRGEDARRETSPELPTPAAGERIPLFARNEWPDELPDPDGAGGGRIHAPRSPSETLALAERSATHLAEPAMDDDTMEPMSTVGDAPLLAAGAGPQVGPPALCKFADHADNRCRIWRGEDEDHVQLGRVCDGLNEQMPRAQLRWSREVLYRVAPAA